MENNMPFYGEQIGESFIIERSGTITMSIIEIANQSSSTRPTTRSQYQARENDRKMHISQTSKLREVN